MVSFLKSLLSTFLTKDTLISLFIILGDYFVEKSSNKLDDKLWNKVKTAFNK